MEEDKGEVRDDRLVIGRVNWVLPIIIDQVPFEGVNLEHGAVEQPYCEPSHLLLAALEKEFLEDLVVAELVNEPSSAVLVFVDVGFEEVEHLRDKDFGVGPLQNCKVEASSKLEYSKFKLSNIRLRLQGKLDIQWLQEVEVSLILFGHRPLYYVEIVVFGQVVLRNNIACVPVLADVIDKVMVLTSEKESVLPVFLVLIDNLSFDLT